MKRHFLTLLVLVLVFSTQLTHIISIQAETEGAPDLEDGEYEMPFHLLTEDEDKESGVILNENNMSKLIVEKGGNEVQITLIPELDLKIEIQDTQPGNFEEDNFVFIDIEDEKTEAPQVVKKISFPVESLNEPLNAKVHLYNLEEEKEEVTYLRFIFGTPQKIDNEESNSNPDPDPDPEPEPNPNPDPEPNPNPDPEPKPNPKPEPEPDSTSQKGSDSDKSKVSKQNKSGKGKYKNGTYELPFDILKSDVDELSNTNQYVDTPAKLIIEKEEYRVQMTLYNSSWWNYFKVQSVQSGNFNNYNFKAVRILKRNKEKDTQLIEFTVRDLDKLLNAKIGLYIKEINYEHQYNIRFKFDTSKLPLNEGYKRSSLTRNSSLKKENIETQSNQGHDSMIRDTKKQTDNRTNNASLDPSLFPASTLTGQTEDQDIDNERSDIGSTPRKTIVAEPEDQPLEFDRDADEAMSDENKVDEEDGEDQQRTPQIAGLNIYQVVLFSVLLVLSIVLLSIQFRKWYKSR